MARMLVATALLALLAGCVAAEDWSLQDVSRRINLKGGWAKLVDTIKAKNAGKTDAKEFVVCYSGNLASRIALLKVLIAKQRLDVSPLPVPPAGAPAGVGCWSATLTAPVKKGASIELDAVATVTGVFSPNPSTVPQGAKQYVEYRDNLFLLSPYEIVQQGITVLLPTSDVKSFTSGGTHSASKVTYASQGPSKPWSVEELKLHFRHNKPLKRVNWLVREIEVSHWGNIYVEETYEIQNAGAEHTGKFSRLQFAHTEEGKGNAFQDVTARLPGPAHSLYYKDRIGNISSSDTTHKPSETTINIVMRYPLMGSWKTDFTLGYSLPLEGFLYRRPKGVLRLLMDLSTSFDDVWVEKLETRIVLPEGAAGIKATLPHSGITQTRDKKSTYLDTVGRPVLVLTMHNVVPEHNKPFGVDYSFSAGAMMREPLLLVAVFAALFAAVSVYNRLDLTITKDSRWAEGQARDRAVGLLQQVAEVWEEEAGLLTRLAGLAPSISSAASAEAAHASRAELEAQLRGLDTNVRTRQQQRLQGAAMCDPAGRQWVGATLNVIKTLLSQMEVVSAKGAASAREHAEKSRALAQRGVKLLGDKADLIKRGVAPHDAADKVAGTMSALLDAIKEWRSEGTRMANA